MRRELYAPLAAVGFQRETKAGRGDQEWNGRVEMGISVREIATGVQGKEEIVV